jgi:acetolactate synthase-1/2/3 large subunit
LPGLVSATKVAARTGCGLVTGSKTNAARHRRGAGAPIVPALPYYFDDIQREVAKYKPQHLLLCGGVVPYAAFGYPEMTEDDYTTLLPPGCAVHVLASPAEDAEGALALLAEAVGAAETDLPAESYAQFAPPVLPNEPNVPLTPRSIGQVRKKRLF